MQNIGITLKLIVDNDLAERVIVTGSSSLELANQINEPLTGRKMVLNLHPITYPEAAKGLSTIESARLVHEMRVFGGYPAVLKASGTQEKIAVLKELTDGALYKDILEFQKIKNPHKVRDLLKALAFQTGNEVSYAELGQLLDLNRQTVESYVNLLEQSFIIYRLPPTNT